MTQVTAAFVVRCVAGNRTLPAAGFVVAAARRNTSKGAERHGTPSTHMDNARAATINGIGQHVYGAVIIRCMKPGIPTRTIEFVRLRANTVSRTMRATYLSKGFHL